MVAPAMSTRVLDDELAAEERQPGRQRAHVDVELVITSGQRKSFQLFMNWNTASVASAGFASGSMICQ